MRAAFTLVSTLLIACAGAPPAPTNDLVVVPVTSPSAQPVAPVAPRATTATNVPPPARDARRLAVRMREELLAVGRSQGAVGVDLLQEAFDREQANDLQGARKAYYELITQHPSSPLVPYAYLAFGDLFFADAEHDSPDKYAMARQAYEKVGAFPPPINLAYAYALAQSASCDMATGDHARALASAKKAIEASRAYPSLPLGDEVAASARKTMLDAYAAAGQPDRAYAFFRGVDPRTAGEMVVGLAERYVRRGASRDVLALYANALASGRDATMCDGAATAAKALAAMPGVDARDVAALEAKQKSACP